MNGLKYQFKIILRDKMCILAFLLPVIAGAALHLISGTSFQNMSEISFGGVQGDLPAGITRWLEQNGNFTQYKTKDELEKAINEPSTQLIGVLKNGNGIRTLLSGDELEVNRVIGNTLPGLYKSRAEETMLSTTIIPAASDSDGLKNLLIAITLVTAMFMGCTFNAMNMISEKEEGIYLVNKILPMSVKTYIVQKAALGFTGGLISTVITALICIRLSIGQIFPFFVTVVLSVYIASLTGLYIGRYSQGLMAGLIYIKMIMILFIAPPVLVYLTVSANSSLFYVSYLLPSSAAFYGLMDMMAGQSGRLWIYIAVLLLHAIFWSVMYLVLDTLASCNSRQPDL